MHTSVIICQGKPCGAFFSFLAKEMGKRQCAASSCQQGMNEWRGAAGAGPNLSGGSVRPPFQELVAAAAAAAPCPLLLLPLWGPPSDCQGQPLGQGALVALLREELLQVDAVQHNEVPAAVQCGTHTCSTVRGAPCKKLPPRPNPSRSSRGCSAGAGAVQRVLPLPTPGAATRLWWARTSNVNPSCAPRTKGESAPNTSSSPSTHLALVKPCGERGARSGVAYRERQKEWPGTARVLPQWQGRHPAHVRAAGAGQAGNKAGARPAERQRQDPTAGSSTAAAALTVCATCPCPL